MRRFKRMLRGSLWRTRAVLWGAAAIAGLVVVGFALLAEQALEIFFRLNAYGVWVPYVASPAICMISIWLSKRFFDGIQGSGIPQVIAAAKLASLDRSVNRLVSVRIALGKVLVGALALTGGISAGREGPSVQVAASIMSLAHRLLPHGRLIRKADLILAGGAAGIAAAFNTPLAGIVFAVEELGRRLESRTSGILVSTIILAGLVAIAIQGNYNYFGQLKVDRLGHLVVLVVLLCGVVCGLLGGIFSWVILLPQKFPMHRFWSWRTLHSVYFAGLCGLAIAFLGQISGGSSFGSGYAITEQVISGQAELAWHAPLTRFLATLISYLSGLPGGIFAPALAIGAALGVDFSWLLGFSSHSVSIIAICMAAFLAAVTQSPITSAIIVMEMIDGHEMVISLMAAAWIAKAVSSRMGPELYQQLARGFLAGADADKLPEAKPSG